MYVVNLTTGLRSLAVLRLVDHRHHAFVTGIQINNPISEGLQASLLVLLYNFHTRPIDLFPNLVIDGDYKWYGTSTRHEVLDDLVVNNILLCLRTEIAKRCDQQEKLMSHLAFPCDLYASQMACTHHPRAIVIQKNCAFVGIVIWNILYADLLPDEFCIFLQIVLLDRGVRVSHLGNRCTNNIVMMHFIDESLLHIALSLGN